MPSFPAHPARHRQTTTRRSSFRRKGYQLEISWTPRELRSPPVWCRPWRSVIYQKLDSAPFDTRSAKTGWFPRRIARNQTRRRKSSEADLTTVFTAPIAAQRRAQSRSFTSSNVPTSRPALGSVQRESPPKRQRVASWVSRWPLDRQRRKSADEIIQRINSQTGPITASVRSTRAVAT